MTRKDLELSDWEQRLIAWLREQHGINDPVPFDLPWRILCLLNALDKRATALEIAVSDRLFDAPEDPRSSSKR